MAGGVKRPAAHAVRKTKLQRALECGVIPKARRPFQCFVAQQGLQFGAAAKIWKTMSEAEKRCYEEESKGSFARQREKARAAGVPVGGGAPQSPPTVREPAVATCHGIRIGQDQQYLVGKALGMEPMVQFTLRPTAELVSWRQSRLRLAVKQLILRWLA